LYFIILTIHNFR